ncbi:Tat pathway signal sequence domain protein [Streptomyces sp. NPDC048566]|uniref:Tat pathway signal sequence domain protein n=1 Tax=Streptomyces sp. NPDC048566 TaxID=3365569 RepID=UPI00371F9995
MTGIGPVEPGEDTRAWDSPPPDGSTAPRPGPVGLRRLAPRSPRHRRAATALAAGAAVLAGGGYLWASRPPEPPPPELPYPAQVVALDFVDEPVAPPGTGPRSFAFAVRMSVASGPPVTVTRITQPYAGLTLASVPPAPFRTKAGTSRKITITMRVTDCGRVPKDAGLPFLEVTLRNARAIQAQSFILGSAYARHLSAALKVACSNKNS